MSPFSSGLTTGGEYEYSECTEYWGLVESMDGMCVAMGCAYQMYLFIVSIVVHGIARDRLVLHPPDSERTARLYADAGSLGSCLPGSADAPSEECSDAGLRLTTALTACLCALSSG